MSEIILPGELPNPLEVDETVPGVWEDGWIHYAKVVCPLCEGRMLYVKGVLCPNCFGDGLVRAGCGAHAQVDPYWSHRGLGANCSSCGAVPIREVVRMT